MNEEHSRQESESAPGGTGAESGGELAHASARARRKQPYAGSLSERVLVVIGTSRTRSLTWRLGVAVAIVLAAMVVRAVLLGGLRDTHFVFVALYPAVAVAAIVGGLGAGVLATVLAALFAAFSLAPMNKAVDWIALATFLAGAAIIVAFAEILHAAQARLAAAERSRQNEERLQAFIDQAPIAIAMFDRAMRYLAVSARWKLDYHIESDPIGRSHYDVFPEIPERWKAIHRRSLAGESVQADEDPFVRKDGSVQWLRWEVRPWYRTGDDVGGIMILSEDMTDRKRAERSLRASESRLRAIVDNALEAIVVIDESGTMQTVNAAAQRIFGYAPDEMVGRNVSMLMPDEAGRQHDGYLAAYRQTGIRKIIGIGREVEGRRRNGSTFPLDLTIGEWRDAEGQRYFTGSMRDISVRKHAEEALARAGRLEAVGRLAGGIAHDFNNLLAVISGNLELAELRVADENVRQFLRKALEAAERGASFNRRLLSFARKRPLEPQRLNLNLRVVDIAELLARSLGEQVALTKDLAPDLWLVDVDAGEIDSAITNLALNARDAMPEGGRLVVATRNVTLDASAAELDPAARPGDYVVLSVSDSGVGMPQDVLQRAMEPFFTTKETGKGTGLGLSSVFGFARQSGGFFALASAVGKGTTASLYLPRAVAQPAAAGQASANVARGAGQTILVVEDDDPLREVTRQRLETLGYRVLEARTAPEAIGRLESSQPIALVFSDVVMPGGMSGHDLVRWIRNTLPHVKVLLTSGYNSGDGLAEAPADIRTLGKPYTLAELARSITDALGEGGAGRG